MTNQEQLKKLLLECIHEMEGVENRPDAPISFYTSYDEKPNWMITITFTEAKL